MELEVSFEYCKHCEYSSDSIVKGKPLEERLPPIHSYFLNSIILSIPFNLVSVNS
jgi:hypothetical protein